MLYEVKSCFNVSIEAQVTRLNQKFINQSKMSTSVKLLYVLPWKKLAIIYPLGFMLNGFKFIHDAFSCLVPGFKKSVYFLFLDFDFFLNNCLVKITEKFSTYSNYEYLQLKTTKNRDHYLRKLSKKL